MLIAEISNCHFGNIKKARQLIRAAHESGADLIKAQAFLPTDIKSGSMPSSFYDQCAFNIEEYLSLIEYARSIGNDLFYSIFSPGFERLTQFQNWHKVAGYQTKNGFISEMIHDNCTTIISIPKAHNVGPLRKFKHAEFLFVSEYMEQNPDLEMIRIMARIFNRSVGYSDHTVGIETAERAYKEYGAHIIEKHFTMEKYMSYENVAYRDSVHGATPKEFEELANKLQG